MSNILYIGVVVVSYTEKSSWANAVIVLVFLVIYIARMLGELERTAAADIDYQFSLLAAIGAALVASIVAHIVLAIAAPRDAGKSDERDRAIDHHGEYAAGLALTVGMLGVLGLVLLEVEHFWIASAMYVVLALSAFIGAAIKVVAYRRGMGSW